MLGFPLCQETAEQPLARACASSHTLHCRPSSSPWEGVFAALPHYHYISLCAHLPPTTSFPPCSSPVQTPEPTRPKGGQVDLGPHPPHEIEQAATELLSTSTVSPCAAQHWVLSQNQGGQGFWRGGCDAETAWRGHTGIALEGQEREVHSLKKKKSGFGIGAAGGATFC